MELLKIKTMAQPQSWWESVFEWIKNNTIIFATFALAWKGIDKVFKYFSDTRMNELRMIVKDELKNHTTPEIERLSAAIDDLREGIWALRNKISDDSRSS